MKSLPGRYKRTFTCKYDEAGVTYRSSRLRSGLPWDGVHGKCPKVYNVQEVTQTQRPRERNVNKVPNTRVSIRHGMNFGHSPEPVHSSSAHQGRQMPWQACVSVQLPRRSPPRYPFSCTEGRTKDRACVQRREVTGKQRKPSPRRFGAGRDQLIVLIRIPWAHAT